MNAEIIVAYGALVTAIGGVIIGISAFRSSARKVQLEDLQEEILYLKKENKNLKRRITCLNKMIRENFNGYVEKQKTKND